jgi:hypothetical protein
MTTKKKQPKPKKIRLKDGDQAVREAKKPEPISLLPSHIDLRLDRDTACMLADLLERTAEEINYAMDNGRFNDLPGNVRTDAHLKMEVFYEVSSEINQKAYEWGEK